MGAKRKGHERCRHAKWKHGFYAKAAAAERRRMHAMIATSVMLLKALRARPMA